MSAGGEGSPALGEAQRAQLRTVLGLLAAEPASLSSPLARQRAWSVHVEDSLSGLALPPLAAARRICDVGAGAGFPGLVLAIALPDAQVDLVESVARKCAFIERAIAAAGIGNAQVACDRAETWAAGAGGGAYDLVTARAVGRLATLAELASPLLGEHGHLVCWKGRRDPGEEDELDHAGGALAMRLLDVRELDPLPGRRHRSLYLLQKTGPTPKGLPRRPGMAKKRPYGSSPR